MITSNDLDMDLQEFMVKALTHMRELHEHDIEGVLRTFTVVAARMAKAREGRQSELSQETQSAELQMLWCMLGTTTSTAYLIWKRIAHLERRVAYLEEDRENAEGTGSHRQH